MFRSSHTHKHKPLVVFTEEWIAVGTGMDDTRGICFCFFLSPSKPPPRIPPLSPSPFKKKKKEKKNITLLLYAPGGNI